MSKNRQITTALVLINSIGISIGSAGPVQAAPDPQPPCCASEFDWATPYAEALNNHGLGYLVERGIGAALAAQDACGLVPAIGAVATVEKLSRDYRLNSGTAGQVLVAAADVCPEISPYLG